MSVRLALLGLLAKKPRHGYELHAAFEAVVGNVMGWDLKPAQVYTTLSRLTEAGLVTCASDLGEGEQPDRRVYAITDQGCQELQEWFASGVEPGHQRDEFYLKLMVALLSGEGEPYRILQTQRAFIFQRLHDTTEQRQKLEPHSELPQILLLEKVIMHLEADLRWLNRVEERLDEIQGQPLPTPEIRRRGRPRKMTR